MRLCEAPTGPGATSKHEVRCLKNERSSYSDHQVKTIQSSEAVGDYQSRTNDRRSKRNTIEGAINSSCKEGAEQHMWCTNQRSCIEIVYSIRAHDFRDHRRRLTPPPSSGLQRRVKTRALCAPRIVISLMRDPKPTTNKIEVKIYRGTLYITDV